MLFNLNVYVILCPPLAYPLPSLSLSFALPKRRHFIRVNAAFRNLHPTLQYRIQGNIRSRFIFTR